MGQGQGRLVGGRYRLTAVVGRGGMGTVWRAHDEVLDRDVAVKEVLLPPGLEEAEQNVLYQRTYREARASARLNHPGVVTVHDVVREDGRPWIIMQLVRARTLQEIIDQDGPLPPTRVAELGQQVLEALNHAHAAGILHRDVKPSNVMITADGRAVLTDFGIAQMPGEVTLTQTGLVMGSPAYIAPERAQGDAAIPASDLWALGATLYTAVEGRSPYERGDAMAALAAALTEDPPPPRRAGRLGPVIEGLLVRDPARRMPAAAALPLLADVASHSGTRPPSARSAAAAVVESPPAPYGAGVEETQRDRLPFGRQPPARFDPGAAETVNDPPVPDAATLLESAAFGPGQYGPGGYGPGDYGPGDYGPGDYRSAPPGQRTSQQAQGETWVAPGQAGTPGQSPYSRTEQAARPPSSGGLAARLKSKRFFLGGVAFAVGVALIVAGLLLWPLLTDQDGNTGGSGNRAAKVAAPPSGYQSVSGTGFSLAVPTGWTRSQNGYSTFWVAPDRNSFVQVDTTPWSVTSNEQAFRAEADAKRNTSAFPDYTRGRISETTYRGEPATDWEFTFTDAQTNYRIHAKDRFVRLGNRSYAIYFRTPDNQWQASGERLDVLYKTFQATG
jgi:hypothetical protein